MTLENWWRKKCYQMCFLNFMSSLISKEIGVYPFSFLSNDVTKLGLRQKNQLLNWDRWIFFSTVVDSSWWADQSICHPFFGRKISPWDIPVWNFEGVNNFSSKIHTETKNRLIQKWYHMCLLNFRSSLIATEIRVYPLLISKWWR